MKIILTVHQFLPDFSTGTEILTFDTARELQKRGHRVEVWTGFPASVEPDEPKKFDQYTYDGIPVQRFFQHYGQPLPLYKVFEYEYNNVFFSELFNKFLRARKPDLVHSFHMGNLSAALISECVKLNIPTVFTATDFWFVCPKCQLRQADNSFCDGPDTSGVNCLAHMVNRNYLNLMPDWLVKIFVWAARQSWWPEKQYLPLICAIVSRPAFLKKVINNIDRVLVPTCLMQKTLLKHGLELNRIRYLPYGINLNNMDKYPLKSPGEKLRLGFIGTLAEHKGAHVLLEAVRLLPDIPLEVYIYGKLDEVPEYTVRLKEIAGDDKRIHFRGTFPNHEIGLVFSQLDCLVVPSIWYENTPLVIYSAQATNTPVIATDLSGMAEVIQHEKNGLLFEKGNVARLTHLLKLIYEDRSLLANLSLHAIKPKSIPVYVNELEEIYNEILLDKYTSYDYVEDTMDLYREVLPEI